MEKYCVQCADYVEYTIQEKQETYPVKGYPVTIAAKVCTCTKCGNQLWDDEIDDQNLKNAYNEYRRLNHLLTPEEIKRIREKYGVSQINFARILGVGDKTIARYENGSIQDEAINNLILLAQEAHNFYKLFEKNAKKLPVDEQKRLTKEVERIKVYYCISTPESPYSYKIKGLNKLAG